MNISHTYNHIFGKYSKSTPEIFQKHMSLTTLLNQFLSVALSYDGTTVQQKCRPSSNISINDINLYRCATLWARIAKKVKKLPLRVNVIDFKFFGFNVPIWVPWSLLGPKSHDTLVKLFRLR